MSSLVDNWLAENNAARRDERRREHLLLSFKHWTDALRARHRATGADTQALDDDDLDTITGYLHDAGQIFSLRERGGSGVLIDQDWATDLIYEMLRPGGRIARVIKRGGGLFEQSALEDDRSWQALDSDQHRRLLLDYMEQCGIIVRIIDGQEQREGKTFLLATEKWLLPSFVEVESVLQGRFTAASGGESGRQAFAIGDGMLSEFDFRGVVVHLGRVLGTRATWFREGLQAVDDAQRPSWCFEVSWRPNKEQDFLGTVEARLVAPLADLPQLAQEVDEMLADAQGPESSRRHAVRHRPVDAHEVWQHRFRDARSDDFDVAISSSGQDVAIVSQLHADLRANGLRPLWYRDETVARERTPR